MATGLIKNNTVIGCETEATEGTYLAPAADTSFIQPLEDGFGMSPAREIIDRNVLNASPGKPTPRLGTKTGAGELPVEFRGSGVEGGEPDFSKLLEGALGARRNSTGSTTKIGNTATVLQIEDADISKYAVGDIVVVEESGAFESRPIVAVDTTGGAANITLAFALTAGAPADNVDISAFQTYHPAATGHPSFSVTYFWANAVAQALIGAKIASLSLDNFVTGQVAGFNFGLESLSYRDEAIEAAPFTPVFDDELPPLILSACMYRNGLLIPVNTFGLNLANTLGFLTDMCSPNGRVSSRVTNREILGTINPHKDDSFTNFFDDWTNGTEFSLFVSAANPGASPGELDLGSIVSIWLPQCFTTEFVTGDLEGILVDDLSFRATRGGQGDKDEMFIGMT